MGLLSRIKATGSTALARIMGNSFGGYQILPGVGSGCNRTPFNGITAMRLFQHWAYAAMMLNANAVANVPLRLYARKPKRSESKKYDHRYKSFNDFSERQKSFLMGREDYKPSRAVQRKVAEFAEDLVEVTEPHPALKVLDRVNEYQNGYELTVLQILDLQIVGDSYLFPVIGGLGIPTEAVRLPPQYVFINPGEKRFIENYEFRGANTSYFAPDEVIHFKMPNPEDVYHGRAWLRAAWDAVALHDAKRQMDLAVYHNMARPDYLVAVKSGSTPQALEEFKKNVNSGNRGPRNAGKFLTVTGDISVTPLNWNTTAESGTATRVIEEISAISGVPVAMLLSNDPTKASSTTARIGWYRNTVRPYCRLHEEKLNQKWLPLFEDPDEMFLCYDSVSFEDSEALSKRVVGEVAGGVRQVNEARIELGLKWLKDYDILYPPSGATGAGAALLGDGAVGQNTAGDNPKQDPEN